VGMLPMALTVGDGVLAPERARHCFLLHSRTRLWSYNPGVEVSMPTRFALIATVVFLAAVPVKNQSAPTALTVVSSNGFQAALEELAPRFEREKKQRLNVTYDLAATLKQRIENGLGFDLAVLTPAAIDDLITSGKIA